MVRAGANDNRAAVYARATSFAVVARGISIACIGLSNGNDRPLYGFREGREERRTVVGRGAVLHRNRSLGRTDRDRTDLASLLESAWGPHGGRGGKVYRASSVSGGAAMYIGGGLITLILIILLLYLIF